MCGIAGIIDLFHELENLAGQMRPSESYGYTPGSLNAAFCLQ
jgi:hypothetical protein